MVPTLVIGVSEDTRAVFDTHMRLESFKPTYAKDGREGLAWAQRGRFELIVSEMVLLDMRGTDLLRSLGQRTPPLHAPVVIVSGLDSEVDRIVAFELGAVDYVTEPFNPRELLLRLRVAHRNRSRIEGSDGRQARLLTLDFEARRVTVQGVEVVLSPREFALLSALELRSGQVCTREHLRDTVWDDAGVSIRSVDASVKRLRKKLGTGPLAIETVRGVGYRIRNSLRTPTC